MDKLDNYKTVSEIYGNVLKAFKKRFDVQNGSAIAYRNGQSLVGSYNIRNKPKSIGDALGTTGWCVIASKALLYDNIFENLLRLRCATAKLISIDIKEIYYGKCYSGSFNKYHTAILVEDNGLKFVIDITCRQFGNNFVGKDIWDYPTWVSTFRSNSCERDLLNGVDIKTIKTNNINKYSDIYLANVADKLNDLNSLNNNERSFLTKLFYNDNGISKINESLNNGLVTKAILNTCNEINKVLNKCYYKGPDGIKYYSVIGFENKSSMELWINNFWKEKQLTQYTLISSNFESLFKYLINKETSELNIKLDDSNKNNVNYYIIFEFNNIGFIEIPRLNEFNGIIPYGTPVNVNKIYNSIMTNPINYTKVLSNNYDKTNTVIIEIS